MLTRSTVQSLNRFKRRSPDATTAASEEHQVKVAKLENSANEINECGKAERQQRVEESLILTGDGLKRR